MKFFNEVLGAGIVTLMCLSSTVLAIGQLDTISLLHPFDISVNHTAAGSIHGVAVSPHGDLIFASRSTIISGVFTVQDPNTAVINSALPLVSSPGIGCSDAPSMDMSASPKSVTLMSDKMVAVTDMMFSSRIWGLSVPYGSSFPDAVGSVNVSKLVGANCSFDQGTNFQNRSSTSSKIAPPDFVTYYGASNMLFFTQNMNIAAVHNGLVYSWLGTSTRATRPMSKPLPTARWETATNYPGQMTFDGNTMYVAEQSGMIRSIDLDSGTATWVLGVPTMPGSWPPPDCVATPCTVNNFYILQVEALVFARLANQTKYLFFVDRVQSILFAYDFTEVRAIAGEPLRPQYPPVPGRLSGGSQIAIHGDALYIADGNIRRFNLTTPALAPPLPSGCTIVDHCNGRAWDVHGLPATGCVCVCRGNWTGAACTERLDDATHTLTLSHSLEKTKTKTSHSSSNGSSSSGSSSRQVRGSSFQCPSELGATQESLPIEASLSEQSLNDGGGGGASGVTTVVNISTSDNNFLGTLPVVPRSPTKGGDPISSSDYVLKVQSEENQQPNPQGFTTHYQQGVNVNLTSVIPNDFELTFSKSIEFDIDADETILVYLTGNYFYPPSSDCPVAPTGEVLIAKINILTVPDAAIVATQQAVAVVSGTATAVSAFTSGGAALDAQTLAVFGLLSCSQPSDRASMKNNRLLSPLATGDTYEAMILGNWILVAAVFLLHSCIVVVFKTAKKISWFEARAASRFPSWSIAITFLQYQGTAAAAIKILQTTSADEASISLGTIAIIATMVLPLLALGLVYWAVTSTFHEYFQQPPSSARSEALPETDVLASDTRRTRPNPLFPVGRWLPVEARQQYGSMFQGLRRPERLWTTIATWSPTLILVALMIRPATLTGCAQMFGVLCGFEFLIAIVILAVRPFRSWPANIFSAMSNVCLGLILLGMSMQASDAGDRNSGGKRAYAAKTLSLHAVQLQMAVTGLRVVWTLVQFVLEKKILENPEKGWKLLPNTDGKTGVWVSLSKKRQKKSGQAGQDEFAAELAAAGGPRGMNELQAILIQEPQPEPFTVSTLRPQASCELKPQVQEKGKVDEVPPPMEVLPPPAQPTSAAAQVAAPSSPTARPLDVSEEDKDPFADCSEDSYGDLL